MNTNAILSLIRDAPVFIKECLSFPLRAWQKQQEKTELPKESEIQRDGVSIVLFDKSSPMLSSNGNKLLQIGK